MYSKLKHVTKIMLFFFFFSLCLYPTEYTMAKSNEFQMKDNVLLSYTGTDKTVKIPEGITTIGKRAFYGNSKAKTIILPDSVYNN